MSSRSNSGAVLLAVAVLLSSGSAAAGGGGKELRVCGDPNNMPFSNEKREGIENRIADVIAAEMGVRVVYTWWPHQRGLVKRVLNTGRCDVMLGIPRGYDVVAWTRPYYRTGYVIVQRKNAARRVRSLDDPALKRLKIGVQVNTPPHEALAQRGIVGTNVVAYQLMFDSKFHPEEYPGKVVEDLIAGRTDVAFVWGPIAGYFQKKKSAPLEVALLEEAQAGGARFAFDISMGVRKKDQALKARLEQAIAKRQDDIRAILEDYGVPLLPISTER